MRPVVFCILLATFLSGCVSDPGLTRRLEMVPALVIANNANQLAMTIHSNLDAMPSIPDAEKSGILARADVLAFHGQKLAADLDAFDPDASSNPELARQLNDRSLTLDREYSATFREWGIWQVQHGLRKPDEVAENPPMLFTAR